MSKTKLTNIFRVVFIALVITASLWLVQQTFWGLINILPRQMLLGLKPLVYLVVIWKAYKWANNEFNTQFNNK